MLRQRTGEGVKPEKPLTRSTLTEFKRFDVYGKVHDDYRVQTRSGGTLSIISIVAMTLLFLNEFNSYLTVDVVDHIIVDTTLHQKLPIGVNVTFPHLRCDEISVDTVDTNGESQVDVHGGMQKIRLDARGIENSGRVAKPGECLSCLEAAEFVAEKQCCNTCQELKDAYSNAGLPYHHVLDTAYQCKDSVGCQIVGDVLVSKVGGNVHVALGKSTVRGGKHVHEFNIKEVNDGFNTSHSINRLEFGERVEGMVSPLEGTTKIVKHGAYMFHYYIKLVPTLFNGRDNRVVYTHQYSVTDNAKNVMVKKGELTGLPGIFLVYEFTPFMVQKIEKSQPFSHFLTSVSAIIGGVFTVASMIDAMLYKSYTGLEKAHRSRKNLS